jgi:tRNA threonylcarbamoyladenosine biosynthesis protein TsaB
MQGRTQGNAQGSTIVLGIDTATRICSAAVLCDQTIAGERSETAAQRHAELLLPFIETVLSESGIRADELDAVAVSIGPGSFTGLRIGLSIAKGIAAGTGASIVPVPTMAAAAHRVLRSAGAPDAVTVLIPARRHEYYAARFTWNGAHPDPIAGPEVIATGAVEALLTEHPADAVAGEGIQRFMEEYSAGRPADDSTADGGLNARLNSMLAKEYHIVTAVETALLSRFYSESDASAVAPLYIKEFESGSAQ